MLSKTHLCYVLCLFVFTDLSYSRIDFDSKDKRVTDITYTLIDDESNSEFDTNYVDFTGKKINGSIPSKIYPYANTGSDVLVSNPKNPLEVIIILRENDKISLPGGWNSYGETPYQGAISKFRSKVHFKKDGEDAIIQVGMYPGLFGRSVMEGFGVNILPNGPFLGMSGVSDRDPQRPSVVSLFHFSISEKYTTPVAGEKVKDAMFCNVITMLARNLNLVTDDMENHPLKTQFDKITLDDTQLLDNALQNNSEITLGELDKCAKEVHIDHILMIYKYYLAMIKNEIINEFGELNEDIESKKYMFNKDALEAKLKNH